MSDEDIPLPPPAQEQAPPVPPPPPAFDPAVESKELHEFLAEQKKAEDAIRAEQDPALDEVQADCEAYREALKKA
jgi:hypothetical protein